MSQSQGNIRTIDSLRDVAAPQVADRKPLAGGTPPAILPVVEMVTHRFLGGAEIRYLAKKYEGMSQSRIEDITRFGANRIITSLRGENARLRNEIAMLERKVA